MKLLDFFDKNKRYHKAMNKYIGELYFEQKIYVGKKITFSEFMFLDDEDFDCITSQLIAEKNKWV